MLRGVGRFFFICLLAGVPPGVAAAQQTAPPPAAPVAEIRAATEAAISVESERKLREAFEHLYNLEFEPARLIFKDIAQTEPQSATASAFWASALLYEILAHQGSLQSQLFVTSNEFLSRTRAEVNPALDAAFHAVAAQAEERARRRLARDPDDTDALFGLGLVYGSRANYLAGAKAEYLEGVKMGEKAFDIHSHLRQLHPELHDTGVVLGVREYIIGNLPFTARFLLMFVGARGDRLKGIEYMREVAKDGEFFRTYAQVLLTVAYIRENQPERALPVLEKLQSSYPRNPIFLVELARLYRQLGKYQQAADTSRTLLTLTTTSPHNPRLVGPEDALLELGRTQVAQRQYDDALKTLFQAEAVGDADKRVLSQVRLERGKIYDRLGKRQQALTEYLKVTALAADAKAVGAANRFRYKAYQPGKDD